MEATPCRLPRSGPRASLSSHASHAPPASAPSPPPQLIALLETSGISRANPYNIVPQGKVNALVLMKDTGRLEMFKDIAGINTYDERRSESVAMMDETQSKQVRANASPRGRASAHARTHGPRSMHAHTSTRWTPSDYRRAISC